MVLHRLGPVSKLLGIGRSGLVGCRFCAPELESPKHLLYECEHFCDQDVEGHDLDKVSNKVKRIILEIYRSID